MGGGKKRPFNSNADYFSSWVRNGGPEGKHCLKGNTDHITKCTPFLSKKSLIDKIHGL